MDDLRDEVQKLATTLNLAAADRLVLRWADRRRLELLEAGWVGH